ncbi:MAG: DUF3311 domain-containing protein [Planctomycetota bacterium]|nr:MAG: DUF3311 domain-containing protein [Planctomycetota bacterium]
MKIILGFLVATVIVLHQDFWNWKDNTLVAGFLPIGLAYHMAYSLIASLTMALLVKYAWPKNLDEDEVSA